MLRIINAALNAELFFAIAKHKLILVEVDAVYTKPFTTTAIMIAPGQTTTVLLNANQVPDDSKATFEMAARPYLSSVFPYNNSTTLGYLTYKTTGGNYVPRRPTRLQITNLPEPQGTVFATRFSKKLRSLASSKYPCYVPKKSTKGL